MSRLIIQKGNILKHFERGSLIVSLLAGFSTPVCAEEVSTAVILRSNVSGQPYIGYGVTHGEATNSATAYCKKLGSSCTQIGSCNSKGWFAVANSDPGTAIGWGCGYGSPQEASNRALTECENKRRAGDETCTLKLTKNLGGDSQVGGNIRPVGNCYEMYRQKNPQTLLSQDQFEKNVCYRGGNCILYNEQQLKANGVKINGYEGNGWYIPGGGLLAICVSN